MILIREQKCLQMILLYWSVCLCVGSSSSCSSDWPVHFNIENNTLIVIRVVLGDTDMVVDDNVILLNVQYIVHP